MSDWEYSDSDCPKCSEPLANARCDECEDEQCLDEDDWEWPFPEHCDKCNGKGVLEWCRECGWDMNYRQFLSPQYEAEWLMNQGRQ